jgi:hypothetical protein
MSTYVMVKRNTKSPYTYPDEHAPFTQYKKVRLSVAFNMVNSRIGWERAKKGDYEYWQKLMIQQRRST